VPDPRDTTADVIRRTIRTAPGDPLTWRDVRRVLAALTLEWPFLIIGYIVGHVAYWVAVGYASAKLDNGERVREQVRREKDRSASER
jgi:carbamoylphosphate synthase small subunit